MMASGGYSSNQQQPVMSLYGQSRGDISGSPDPYYLNVPNVVNLSGKIGPAETNSSNSGSSLLSTVTSAVENSYYSARNVVLGGAGDSMSSGFNPLTTSYQQIVNFSLCFVVGGFFMFLAFLFLPMVVFAPQKFVLLFTLGSLCWLGGLASLQGVRSLMIAMVHKERLPFSIAYCGSLLGTFYATLVAHSYILTILAAGIQIFALLAFIISYFPGGSKMLWLIKDIVLGRIMGVFGASRNGGSSSVLPI